ncbi:760_t:CDS:10 [Entrophospora sp. SA101]|nr:3990_t:CDS:10 [Entrophospora sp. SA101]CAJ0909024.1 760_t:CDS:10 [Entrophospora sp. SA101]
MFNLIFSPKKSLFIYNGIKRTFQQTKCLKEETKKTVRVRFAPSPTGYLHLGSLRTALFNYLFAKKNDGQFILRIEDTDKTRSFPKATESLISVLSWTGLNYDEGPGKNSIFGPFIQSERTEIYRDYANKLLKDDKAYRCFCTSERLHSLSEASQKAGRGIPEGITIVKDLVYGKIEFDDKHIDDVILMKGDGYPTYHFANVVDDHLMKITHVLRGEEWLPSTPKHIILYQAFGWEMPYFVHLPLLLNVNKSKLSKRSKDAKVEDYVQQGYLPEALINFVAFLGWNPSCDNKEVYTLKELISSVNNIGRSGAIVTREKLDWFNKQHLLIKTESSDGLNELVSILKASNEKYKLEDEYLSNDRIHNIKEISSLCDYFFIIPDYSSSESINIRAKLPEENLKSVIKIALDEFTYLKETDFQIENIKSIIKKISQTTEIKYIQVGAGVVETIKTLGKNKTLQHINALTQVLDS